MTNTQKKEINLEDLNIYQKMSLITTDMAVIEKNLEVEMTKTKKYKAVSERDVLDNVKPLEAKYHVYSFPLERNVIDKDTLVKETEYNGNITKTNIVRVSKKSGNLVLNHLIDDVNSYYDKIIHIQDEYAIQETE